MDEHSYDPSQQPPARRPRRKRPHGRWTNPASPLQAARFALRLNGRTVVAGIRAICPGHAGEPCRMDVSKLSDHETGNRRPGVTHIEAFARFYRKSPEELGLIKWRDASGAGANHNGDHPTDPIHHLVGDYLNDHPAARLLAGLLARDLPLSHDASVNHLLVHLLSETVVLSAVTTHLLRASIEEGDPATTGALV